MYRTQMYRTPMRLLVLLVAMGGVACQSTDGLRTMPAETAVQPRQVSAAGPASYNGRPVAWGGAIVEIRNLKDRTRLAVLAFPLDGDGVPKSEEASTGRFIAEYWSYLDPADYAVGRQVTVRGTVAGVEKGSVGEAPYVYPRLEAVEVRLWPQTGASGSSNGWWPPQLHIGIGVYGGF